MAYLKLPSEYQEVEYLESTGTQWIKTDILGRFTATFESVIEFTKSQDTYSVGFKDGDFRIGGNGWYNQVAQIGYGPSWKHGASFPVKSRHKYKTVFEPGNQYIYIDDVLTNEFHVEKNVDTLSGTMCFAIFGRLISNTTADLKTSAKMYYLKVSDNDDILGNFIPCYRRSDNEPGMYDTVTNTFYANAGTGEFLVGGDVIPDSTVLKARRQILMNTPHLESASGQIATFNTDLRSPLKSLKVAFTPVQEGSGDPSPDNVRPITGWDGVTVTRCGDIPNEPEWEQGAINAAYSANVGSSYNYHKTSSTTRIRIKTLIALNPDATYHIVWDTENFELVTQPYDINGKSLLPTAPHNIWSVESYEISNVANVAIALRKKDQSQIVPADATSAKVKIYSLPATSITIPFPQTIYGGYVDLVKGEVVEEWERRNFEDFSSITKSSGTSEPWLHRFLVRHWVTGKGWSMLGSDKTMSDCFKNANADSDGTFSGVSSYFYDSTVSTATEFREKYTGHYVAYLLKPEFCNTYPLDPVTIKTLKGINNIWSNANGEITVKFWKH